MGGKSESLYQKTTRAKDWAHFKAQGMESLIITKNKYITG